MSGAQLRNSKEGMNLMSVRLGNKISRWKLVATLSFGVIACGGPESKYEDKEYGQAEEEGPVTTDDQSGSDDAQGVDSSNSGESVSGNSNGNGTDATPSTGEEGSGSGIDVGDGGINIPPPKKIEPDEIILNSRMKAQFRKDSVKAIDGDDGIIPFSELLLGSTKKKMVMDRIVTNDDDGMIVFSTYGNGVDRSTVTQIVTLTGADEDLEEGENSSTGVQYMDRLVGPDCPGTFLCIDRFSYVPNIGTPFTLCFEDAEGNRTAIPYGLLPNYTAAQQRLNLGEYGPFTVKKYAGDNVACDAVEEAPLLTENVMVDFSEADLDGLEYEWHVVNPIEAEYSVVITRKRTQNDNRFPYIDETIKFTHRNQYYISEVERGMSQLRLTTRKTVDVNLFNSIDLNGLLGFEGVAVELIFDYCQNLMPDAEKNDDGTPLNHCPDRAL